MAVALPVRGVAAAGTYPTPVSISAGEATSFFIGSDGSLWGWGENNHGQVGDGTTTMRLDPTAVAGLSGVRAVSTSGNHTLAITSDQTVWAWGANEQGQLGTGTTAPSATPEHVAGLDGVIAVAAGGGRDLDYSSPGDVSLALKNDGSVWGWGAADCLGLAANPGGWLDGVYSAQTTGTGTGITAVPTQIPGLSNIVAISASWCHGLALDGNGTVWEFGAGEGGFPASGLVNPQVVAPWPIFQGAIAIAAGQFSDLMLRADHTVWGTSGLFGSPAQVAGLDSVTAISAGPFGSAALRSDGTVWVWGRDDAGELGNGTAVSNQSFPPTLVPGLYGVAAIQAGWDHLVALRHGGLLLSWGGNDVGQLGIGTNSGPETCPDYASPNSCSTTPLQIN